jgi:enamine deaminase RidA (YjgF/YER057c/UK114 family)
VPSALDCGGGGLEEAGSSLADVVRTRIIVRHVEDADAVARVHGQFFADVRPANTLLRGEPMDQRRGVTAGHPRSASAARS